VLSKEIKQYNSNSRIILGGPHATFDYKSLLSFDFIDYVVLGEAEFTFLELCQRIRDNKPINDIRGLAYRDNGEVKANLFRPLIDNLDSLPSPARDLVEFQNYIQSYGVLEKSVDVMSSRGCTNCCVFCSSASFFGRWRARSPENIIHEIEDLIQKYPIIKSINFLDDSFTADKSRVIRLCKLLIDHKLARLDWVCLSRVDQLNEEVIEAMKSAGCVRVHLGIESGSETILKNINKRISLSSAKNAVKLLSKAGIESYSFFMVGHPGETKETINSTRMVAKEIKSTYSSFFVSQIFPGTGLEQLQPVECWAEYIYEPEILYPSIFTHPCVPNYIPKGFTRETLKKICSALTKELIPRSCMR
jgi:anaerobic magnesium-protoporphyrin IX monomethyl ester cyclase